MADINELESRARTIQNETQEGQNTAYRVGSLFYDIIQTLKNAFTGIAENSADKTKVTVNPFYAAGTKIASISVNSVTEEIYVPNFNYDDTGIKGSITSLQALMNVLDSRLTEVNSLANSEKVRLDGVINSLNTTITQHFNDLLNDATWMQQHWPEGDIVWSSGWDDNVEAYLQKIGVWARNGSITKTDWTTLTQKVNTIELAVNALSSSGSITEELQSSITTAVNDGIANLNLSTTYASKDAEKVIEWLYSGLKSSTSADRTFTQIASAGKNALNSAISEIRTQVDKLKNGDYVSTASFETMVNDCIAGLYQNASASDASSSIFAKVKKNSDDIAAIVTAATGDSTSATIATKFSKWKAGLVTTADLSSATSSLMAANDFTAANITALVNAAGSSVGINADKIMLNGQTWADFIGFNSALAGDMLNRGITIEPCSIKMRNDGSESSSEYTDTYIHLKRFGSRTIAKISGSGIELHSGIEDASDDLLNTGNLFLKCGGVRYSYGDTIDVSTTWDKIINLVERLNLTKGTNGTYISEEGDFTITANGFINLPSNLRMGKYGSGYLEMRDGVITGFNTDGLIDSVNIYGNLVVKGEIKALHPATGASLYYSGEVLTDTHLITVKNGFITKVNLQEDSISRTGSLEISAKETLTLKAKSLAFDLEDMLFPVSVPSLALPTNGVIVTKIDTVGSQAISLSRDGLESTNTLILGGRDIVMQGDVTIAEGCNLDVLDAASGSFPTGDGRNVTVTNGIITAIY